VHECYYIKSARFIDVPVAQLIVRCMVTSVPVSSKPPRQVLTALLLIGADFLLSAVQMVKTVPASWLSAFAVIFASILALWIFGLYRRLNWLRWFTVGSAVLGILCLPFTWPLVLAHVNPPFMILKYAFFDFGALLLCLPQARSWYSRLGDT
jgi:hypothetical protein